MSRTRMIKPAFFKHAELYQAEAESRLPLRVAFAGLWTVADKEGRFRWKMDLKPDILPYDPVDIMAVLDGLERYGFIVSYVVDGKRYGFIPSFKDHQTFHKTERESTLPAPPTDVTAPMLNGESTVRHMSGTGTGTGAVIGLTALVDGTSTDAQPDAAQQKRRRSPAPLEPPLFAIAWTTYPKRAGSNSRRDALAMWLARVREGVSEADMLAGTERYRSFCEAMGKFGTETVMQAKRFYGRAREFAETWEIPRQQSPPREESALERRTREEREEGERRRIAQAVQGRRARGDGDRWWDRMQREANTTNGNELYRYAAQHIGESGDDDGKTAAA